MAVLTVQTATIAGAAYTYAAAAGGGDTFPNTGREALHVKNASGGSINVTIDSTVNCNQGFDHDVVIAVAAAVEKAIGPFPQNRFGSTVSITYSAVGSVTVAVTKVA